MKFLIWLFLISIFCFPAFSIPVGKPIHLYFITSAILVIAFVILCKNYVFKIVQKLIRKTPSKYIFQFFLWLILDGLLLVVLGKYSLMHYLYYMITILLIIFINLYILPSLIMPKMISVNAFIKFLFMVYFFVCIMGVIQFFGEALGISIINNIFEFIDNTRFLASDTASLYEDRLASVFEEPGWFASFMFLNLPIMYSMCESKYRIFTNNILNIIAKKTIIPLAWICIILTKSPIWLLFSLILTGLHFRKHLIHIFKKYFVLTIVLLFALYVVFNTQSIDLTETYLNRIAIFFTSITDWSTYVQDESSLSTRLVSYYYTIKIFLSNILLGVGLGNAKFYTLQAIFSDQIELPYEILNHIMELPANEKNFPLNGALFYDILSDSGLIGFVLFYRYLIKNIIVCKKVALMYMNKYRIFLMGLYEAFIAMLYVSIYDINYISVYIWIMLGLVPVFINNIQKLNRN